MKRFFSLILACALLTGFLSACSSKTPEKTDDTIRIVATIFPEYDWVVNILGENAADAELTLLLDNGVDLHSYQPTAEDILKISNCDLFLYVGGESDEWAENALSQAVNKDMQVINLLEKLGDRVKEEEIAEGMQHDHEHGEDHDHEEEGHDHEHEEEYDEHVWLSLRDAALLCDCITGKLSRIDPRNAARYAANNEAYKKKILELDERYTKELSASAYSTLLFGDRFPFRYLTEDYGLTYYAAFAGCSAESEASFETIIFLANKVDELDLPAILTIENSDGRIASAIRENTTSKDQKILSVDSMQSVTAEDVSNGASYLTIMEDNLAVFREALNTEE